MATTIEREVKLLVPDSYRLPELDGVADGVTATELDPQNLRATYHDVADLRLVRQGITLRHRTEHGKGVWTLKLPIEVDNRTTARREIRIEGGPKQVPQQIVSL